MSPSSGRARCPASHYGAVEVRPLATVEKVPSRLWTRVTLQFEGLSKPWRAGEPTGRLIAYLSSRTRDVAGAEDALSDALISALTTWPRDGIP